MFEFFMSLVIAFGYLGIFVVAILGSISIIIPIPGWLVLVPSVSFLNPILTAIVYGLGSAIGELTGYFLGLGSEKLLLKTKKGKERKQYQKWFDKVEVWFQRHGGFAIIMLFAITPLPDDFVGIFCGAVKYDIRKFLLAQFIGKVIMSLILIYFGFYGLSWLARF